MRIYTTAPYTVDNNGLSYVKIFLSLADSLAMDVYEGKWRLVFDKFTMDGSPYSPLFLVSVSGDGLNYDSYENNFPSSPITDWDPNPAESNNTYPNSAGGSRQIGLSLNCSPNNSNMTVDFDFTIEVDVGGGTWVPLFSLLSEPLTVRGSDSSFPDESGTDLVATGLIVMEGGEPPVDGCFWENVVNQVEDCGDDPDPGGDTVDVSLIGYQPGSGGVAFHPEDTEPLNSELTGATEVRVLGYYSPTYDSFEEMPSTTEFVLEDYTFNTFSEPLLLTTGNVGPGLTNWWASCPEAWMPHGLWAYGRMTVDDVEYYCVFVNSGGF